MSEFVPLRVRIPESEWGVSRLADVMPAGNPDARDLQRHIASELLSEGHPLSDHVDSYEISPYILPYKGLHIVAAQLVELDSRSLIKRRVTFRAGAVDFDKDRPHKPVMLYAGEGRKYELESTARNFMHELRGIAIENKAFVAQNN